MAEILYQGHGSFRLTTSEGSVIYIDPYAGEGYDRPADLVLVSHEHHDHNAVELVKRKEDGKILRAGDVLKDGVYQEIRACGVKIKGTQAYNQNHPKDQCVGFVVEMEGKKLYFACDTSRTEAMEQELSGERLDYAFLPIDGVYNMGPEEASRCAAVIGAVHSVPVHMMPGALFDRAAAEKFQAEGRVIVEPGETICW